MVVSNENKTLPLVLVPQYFGSIIYDYRTYQYMPFDREATLLFIELKEKSINEILNEIEEQKGRKRIWQFFNYFYKHGFFTFHQKFAGSIQDIKTPSDHLVGPLTLHLELTDSCNLQCRHCSAGQLPRNKQMMDLEDIEGLFKSMKKIGTFRLGLTGGEPLLREDLFDIIDLAIEYGLSPCLTTNGLLLTERIAEELGQRELAWLNISLEGASSQTHDYIRGKGTFNDIIKKIAMVSKHCHFSLAFTLMKSNFHEARACARLAERVGAQAAVFRPLYPVGTANQHSELMLSFSDYLEALNDLAAMEKELNTSYIQFCNTHPWGPQTRIESRSMVYRNFGCGAGNLVCSVSASGDISPCSYLPSTYIAGNIKDLPLERIWSKSMVFNHIRSLKGNTLCDGCESYRNCLGGCRARALSINKSINAPDSWACSQKDTFIEEVREERACL
jgi:radical SAM protein with 4Fe4S-binding SPASM domain